MGTNVLYQHISKKNRAPSKANMQPSVKYFSVRRQAIHINFDLRVCMSVKISDIIRVVKYEYDEYEYIKLGIWVQKVI